MEKELVINYTKEDIKNVIMRLRSDCDDPSVEDATLDTICEDIESNFDYSKVYEQVADYILNNYKEVTK